MTKKAEEWQGLIRGVYSRAGPVADSDLQISSSEWGGFRSRKKIISALQASVCFRYKGGGGGGEVPPLDPPLRVHYRGCVTAV